MYQSHNLFSYKMFMDLAFFFIPSSKNPLSFPLHFLCFALLSFHFICNDNGVVCEDHGLLDLPKCFAIICFFIVRSLFQKNKPMVKWPVVGMLPSLLLNVHRLHDWYTEVLRTNGCTILFEGPWLSGMKMQVTSDPRNLTHILGMAHFSNYPKGQDFYEKFDLLGDGILGADYGSWKVQRKMAHAHFRTKRFRNWFVKTGQEKVEKGLIPVLQIDRSSRVEAHGLAGHFAEVHLRRYVHLGVWCRPRLPHDRAPKGPHCQSHGRVPRSYFAATHGAQVLVEAPQVA
ncbi:alkane hydroxylase MAH1-like protein [Cinnamomum micranthum f. kanehirae]|uniref:Alkane hydroxylase MAH1-like protein n=1 Tax=Cinnamomum micranthum f. kanehirae TaxID=337451 RepID=A0A443NLM3_9MAGN|nr:alkane hydroxylase MAH1-like protein [Cinnamomum micranthum f. kanehirae]